MVLVVTTSHLTCCHTDCCKDLVLVVVLVSVAVRVVTFHTTATTALATTSTMLVSLTTAHVLITIILIVTLSLTHVMIATMHSWWTGLILGSVLFLYCVYQFGHVIDVFISDCILSFVLGLPEVNS